MRNNFKTLKSIFENKMLFLNRFIRDSNAGVAVYTVPELILLEANPKYIGYVTDAINSKENIIGQRISDFIPNWRGSRAEKALIKIAETNETLYLTERQGLLGSQDKRYWDNTIMPIDINGEVKFVVSILEDVSEKVNNRLKKNEYSQMIKQQAEQLQAIIENMSDGVLLLDQKNNFTFLNKGAKEFFYHPDSINKNGDGPAFTKYYDSNGKRLNVEELPGTRTLLGETIKNFLLTAERPDKTVHYSINSSPVFDEKGKVDYAILCMRDITEKVKQENIIKEKKEQLEVIMENMTEALCVCDKNGKYVLINKKGRERLRKSINKAGESFDYLKYYDLNGNLIPYEDFPIYHVLHGRTVSQKIMRVKFLDDEEDYVSISGSPIFDEKGNFLYGIFTFHNVTEKMKSENIIKQQQELILQGQKKEKQALEKAIKMKDEFLSTITHEFKTPLAVINAAIQTINKIYANELSENVKKHIQIIRMNTYRQLRLVNNLLDITKYNAGHIKLKKQNLDIVFLTREITKSVKEFAEQKGVNLEYDTDIGHLEILIDDEKFERIILNLLSNAIKFTPKGKSIQVFVTRLKKNVLITVKDEGVGIPKDKHEHIFERFGQVDSVLTRQAEGTGIGLSLVKSLVMALNGTITLESEIGFGSKFTITLPIKKERKKSCIQNNSEETDSRIMQAAAIEFSDIYLN